MENVTLRPGLLPRKTFLDYLEDLRIAARVSRNACPTCKGRMGDTGECPVCQHSYVDDYMQTLIADGVNSRK